MSTLTLPPSIESLKSRLHNTWMAGDYYRFSRFMENDAMANQSSAGSGSPLFFNRYFPGIDQILVDRTNSRIGVINRDAKWMPEVRPQSMAPIDSFTQDISERLYT